MQITKPVSRSEDIVRAALYVHKDTYEKVKDIAAENGVSINRVLNHIILEALENEQRVS